MEPVRIRYGFCPVFKRLLAHPKFFPAILVVVVVTTIVYATYYRCDKVQLYYWEGAEPHFPIDYHETPDDILSDIIYDRELSSFWGQPKQKTSDNIELHQKLFYQKQIALRKKLVGEIDVLTSLETLYFPQLECATLVRVGNVTGGYVVCNPWVLAKASDNCVLYSLGINGPYVDFERDFYEITNGRCKIFCFDQNAEHEPMFEPFKGTFFRASISNETDVKKNQYSLLDLTRKYDHEKIDVLKIDIEGAEFTVLPIFLRKFNGTICHLTFELHGNRDSDARNWRRLFQMVERRGFRLYYREIYVRDPRCYHYSYLHLNCLEKYGLKQDNVLFRYFD